MNDAERLIAAHEKLQAAYDSLLTLRGDALLGAGPDTCVQIGMALGTLTAAKALVGRDIDMHRKLA